MNLDLQMYRKQYQFFIDKTRYCGFIGGIGTGKTRALVLKAFVGAFKYPGSYSMITAPTYPMLRDATKRTFFELVPPELIAYRNDSENICGITTASGTVSHITFRSTSDPDSLRGPNLIKVHMDEAAMSTEEAFLICMGRIRDTRFPAEAQQINLATTPKGLNWVWKHFGPASREAEYSAYYATVKDNPFLDSAYIESLYKNYQGSFAQQELDGKFVAYEGLIYGDLFNYEAHCGNFPFNPDLPVDLCWDFGYPNPEVALAIQQDARGQVYLIDELYRYKTLTEDIAAECRARPWFGKVWDCIADEARPDSIVRLQQLGIPARPSNKGKILDGIKKVRSLLDLDDATQTPILHIDRKCDGLIKEFSLYRWAEKRAVTEEWIEKPIDQFNHALDALRYWTISKWHPTPVVTNPKLRKSNAPTRRVMSYQLLGRRRP